MAITLIDQETQIRNTFPTADYDDTLAPSLANFETSPTNLKDDLNTIRSQLHNLLKNQAGNWYDDLNTPAALDTGAQRGVNDLNTDLHALERKRVLVSADKYLVDITVGAGNNFKVLALGELPPNTTAAVGAVTTRGTVSAFHAGTFGTHSLDEVSGSSAIAPKNLCNVVDGNTHDPILSDNRVIYALFQVESNTDGQTLTGTTPNRAQLSFVRINSTGDDLEAVPFADIENKVIHYSVPERKALEDLSEQDFLRGAVTDVPASATVTRQVAYNNQGTTPVDLTTNATLDLEGPGLVWAIRDDLEANLFRIVEGSAGGTSTVEVSAGTDVFDVDAVANNFLNGSSFDTGAAGTTINVGVTANQIDAGGLLKVASGGGADLSLAGALELNLTDSYRSASTWSLADGVALANSSSEWSAFETAFGEVSLLNAIVQAKNTAGRRKVYAVVTSALGIVADTNVSGPAGDNNVDTDFGDLSQGTFISDYDIYLNGVLQYNGANAAANKDVYPGTSLAAGQIKFEKRLKLGDVIIVVDWAN
jgi:hypothetical protein